MSMKTPYAKVLKNNPPRPPKEFVEVEVPEKTAEDYRCFAEAIAGHRLYERGKFIAELKEAMPELWRLWHVDRYFPYAKGGPLFVDEPKIQADVEESNRKQKVAVKLGIRMIVLEMNDSLDDGKRKLFEVDQCLGQPQKTNSANS